MITIAAAGRSIHSSPHSNTVARCRKPLTLHHHGRLDGAGGPDDGARDDREPRGRDVQAHHGGDEPLAPLDEDGARREHQERERDRDAEPEGDREPCLVGDHVVTT